MTEKNPFREPAPKARGKSYFGRLEIQTHSVELESGASYVVPGITYPDGNLREFRGKKKKDDGSGQHTHVIVTVETRNREGNTYKAARDFLYWQDDVCQRVTIPSLQEHFGKDLSGIWGKSAWVQARIEEIEDGDYTRQAFVVERVFDNRQQMEDASMEFFDNSSQNEDIPWDDDEPDADDTAVESAFDVSKVLPTFWESSGKDKGAFLNMLKATPVVQFDSERTQELIAAFLAEQE